MKALAIIVSIILFILSLVLAAVVLFQESKETGLSGAIGGSSETFVSKKKARTMQGKLARFTKILGACYLVLALILYFLVA